jgi:hypothetical protein
MLALYQAIAMMAIPATLKFIAIIAIDPTKQKGATDW